MINPSEPKGNGAINFLWIPYFAKLRKTPHNQQFLAGLRLLPYDLYSIKYRILIIFNRKMKHIIHKIPPIFKNFYFLAASFFLIWMLFFDSNDLITQLQLNHKLSELEETRTFYGDRIVEVKNDREALLNDEALLEKIAREKYLMKKASEDLFIVVEEE